MPTRAQAKKMEMVETIGQLLKEERTRLGLSQEAMAPLLDVSQGTLNRWENEEVVPPAAQWPMLMVKLRLDEEELGRHLVTSGLKLARRKAARLQ